MPKLRDEHGSVLWSLYTPHTLVQGGRRVNLGSDGQLQSDAGVRKWRQSLLRRH